MNEIKISKFSNSISMWEILLIYQSITNEFLREYNKRKNAIEYKDKNLIDFGIECSYEGKAKVSFMYKDKESIYNTELFNNMYLGFEEHLEGSRQISEIDVLKTNKGKNDPCPCGSGKKNKNCIEHLLDYNSFSFSKEDEEEDLATNKALEDLVAFCSSFIKSIRSDLNGSIKMIFKDNVKYSLDFFDNFSSLPIDKIRLIYYGIRNRFLSTGSSLVIRNEKAVIDEEYSLSGEYKKLKSGPQINYKNLPNLVKDYIKRNTKDNNILSYTVSLDGNGKVVQEPVIAPEKPIKQEVKNQTDDDLSEENKQRHKKELFRKLKEFDLLDDKLENEQIFKPFPIKEDVFFSSITDEKKEIDPFFKENPGVMQYCNLSFLNFDKADIRGFDFSNNREAKINLKTIYNRDITGTNLKNNHSLRSQVLKDVIANGANLMGTGVFVPLEFVLGTEGTIFDETCRFSLGIQDINHDELRKAGYTIAPMEFSPEDEARKVAIYSQNKAQKEGTESLFNIDEEPKLK